jgi:hypothetical protein
VPARKAAERLLFGPNGGVRAERRARHNRRVIRLACATTLLACFAAGGCMPREDPARAELRARLAQQTPLSADEVRRALDQVGRELQGKSVQAVRGPDQVDLEGEQREVVLGMLQDRAGVFDEGLRSVGGAQARVFNAPGRSTNPEIEASRRLFVDIETLLPRRFEFAYAFPSPDDYAFDLRAN